MSAGASVTIMLIYVRLELVGLRLDRGIQRPAALGKIYAGAVIIILFQVIFPHMKSNMPGGSKTRGMRDVRSPGHPSGN